LAGTGSSGVLLTVFHKTRSAETREVERAIRAHGPAKTPTTSRMTSSNAREAEMSAKHSSYEQIARERRRSADYREGYDEARRAFLIGQAVRERRLALGLSQTEVADRAG